MVTEHKASTRVGLVFRCFSRLPEVGTLVPNIQELIFTMNFILLFVIYCILKSSFVDQYNVYKNLYVKDIHY